MLRTSVFILVAALMATPTIIQEVGAQDLGTIDFKTSAKSAEAQEHFLHGVLLLHSFTFESAEKTFKAALAAEPDFFMAYWGEAMSHNHPLLPERNPDLPRAVLKRLGATPEERLEKAPTEREKGFLAAVELLFGEGSEEERATAYSEAMGELATSYPDDAEVQAFYAVSLLGRVRFTRDKDFRIRMKAGAIAENIYREHPDHPGAAHYIIHSFDDPVHAPLALTAAYRYAEIAPDAAHAIHMPSHIFIQHGMWDRVVKSNDASYAAAIRLWQKRDGLTDTEKFYNDVYIWHALDWGQYGQLQRGDYEKAMKSVELLKPVAAISKASMAKDGPRTMAARYVVESEQWKTEMLGDDATPEEVFANGMSAVKLGETETAEKAEAKLMAMYDERKAKDGEDRTRPLGIMAKELGALVKLGQGQGDDAMALMKEATALAEDMGPPAGAATPIKPAYELYGEILLELGKADEAAEQFETSLLRMQNRTLSLRGMARAAEKSDDAEAARTNYEKLLEILGDNPENPSYQEAKGFVSDGE